jgi:hypothetical protein
MHEFDRAADQQSLAARAVEQARRLHHQERAKALAAGKACIAHRFEKPRWPRALPLDRLRTEQAVEHVFHIGRDAVETLLEQRVSRGIPLGFCAHA